MIILLSSRMILSVLDMSPLTKDYLRCMMFVMAYYAVAQTFDETLIVGIFSAVWGHCSNYFPLQRTGCDEMRRLKKMFFFGIRG